MRCSARTAGPQPGLRPRPYRGEEDLQAMRRILVEGRQAGGPAYYVHVGDLDWWLFYLDPDFEERVFLWEEERSGAVAGWVLLSARFRAFDAFVRPGPAFAEGRLSLFRWAEERLTALVREQGGQDLSTTWVSGRDGALAAHLEARGFLRCEEHTLCLQRSLEEPIPPPPMPSGFRVRPVAGEEEVAQRAALSHATFGSGKSIEAYTQNYLRFTRSPAYRRGLDLVVELPDGRFAAFCICWLDETNHIGHLEPVGTGPQFRRLGLGSAAVLESLRRMRALGMRAADVCTGSGNVPALRLYESVGFRPALRIYTYEKSL